MDNSLMQQQADAFAREQKAFEQARAKYLEACQTFQPFKAQEHVPSPPLTRAAYSDRMAWILATMAQLAYTPFEKQEEELAHLEFGLKSGSYKLVTTFNIADTQAFLAKHDSYAVLCFRGTQSDSPGDIKTDIAISLDSTRYGKVHDGFKAAYNDVGREIARSITDLGSVPLYITGHSLGGALATIATQRLEHRIKDQIAACYTYGSPRVGNADFEKSIKAPFYRIINCTDGVPLLPLAIMGYTHVGDARYLTRSGELRRGVPFVRVWDMMAAMFLSLPHILKPFVAAHDIGQYIQKLEKIALNRNKR